MVQNFHSGLGGCINGGAHCLFMDVSLGFWPYFNYPLSNTENAGIP